MSEVMLQGVLRMPTELWCNEPWDISQRHSRYIQAANELNQLEAENAKLREALKIIAGHKQCLDNTLSNAEVAQRALAEYKGE